MKKELVEKLRLLGAGVESNEGGYVLPLLEAAYFAEKGVVEGDSKELLEEAGKGDGLAQEKYAVLKHLRDRGYIVRCGAGDAPFMRVYRKGIRVGEDRTIYLLKVVKGKDYDLLADLGEAGKMRKTLVYAFVDGEKIAFVGMGRISFE